MNVLYKGVNTWGINSRIMTPLFERHIIDACVFVSRTQDDLPDPCGHELMEISAELAWENRYEDLIDRKLWNPLPRYVLEGMKQYEANCLYLANRIGNYDVYTVYEAREQYLYHLQFWNHIIDTKQIDALVLPYFPHLTWEYVIYCLCRIKSIPVIAFNETPIKNRFSYGTTMEKIGDNIEEIFSSVEDDVTFANSSEDLIQYYNSIRNKKTTGTLNLDFIEEQRKSSAQEAHRFINEKTLSLYDKKYNDLKYILEDVLKADDAYKNHRAAELDKICRDFETVSFHREIFKRCLKKYKRQVQSDYYDKMSRAPEYGQKYIYFGLQMQPELTSLPNGGVFHDQLLSLAILSRAAEETGVYVYVKEHFVQISRDKKYYDTIAAMPNVILVHSNIDSISLIDGSIAVSTQTGSNIIEAAIRGKPSIVFGEVYNWKGLPGLTRGSDHANVADAIRQILTGRIVVHEAAVKRYFIAIDMGTVRNHAFDVVEAMTPQIESDIKQMQKLIADFLLECQKGE